MNYRFFPVAALAMASFATVGCGAAADDDATRLPGASPTQSQAPSQTPVSVTAPSAHLYFNATDHLHVSGDTVAQMTLNAGAVVEMEVATADSSPLRFELWQ